MKVNKIGNKKKERIKLLSATKSLLSNKSCIGCCYGSNRGGGGVEEL